MVDKTKPIREDAWKTTAEYREKYAAFRKHLNRLWDEQSKEKHPSLTIDTFQSENNSPVLLAAIRTYGPKPQKGRPGLRVVSIGCGLGLESQALAKHGHEVINSDLDEGGYLKDGKGQFKHMQEKHYAKGGLPGFMKADATRLPLPQNSVDVVLSKWFLLSGCKVPKEYQQRMIEESKRVLKPGGILLIDQAFERNGIHELAREYGFKSVMGERTGSVHPFEGHTYVLKRV